MASENPEELENQGQEIPEAEIPEPEISETENSDQQDPELEVEAATDSELSDSESSEEAPELEKLKKIVEGAIFAAAKPMTIDNLGALFGEDERPSREDFRAVLAALTEEYADRGVMLKEVSSGFRFQVREDVGQWVSRMWEEKPARYSRALLETLALIAYRQPITRGEIEEIRGVSTSSHIMKTLQEREWVRVVGHRDVPGRPAMYATTRYFLDYFNLRNIDELPSLAEIRDLDEINRELDLGDSKPPTEGQALDADTEENEAETGGLADETVDSVPEEQQQSDDPEASDTENEQQTEVETRETGYTS